ncbi:hypothetical protein BJF78_23770 [Pseudonocardia sp. CNS-139]|nr:hypothetical protein BJF78_23770 [Pseudonocardia sp. CNS-139]
MKLTRRAFSVLAVITASTLALTACGSRSPDTPEPGQALTVSSAELQQSVDGLLANPTALGFDEPLSRRPEPGRTIIGLLTPLATAQTESAAQAEAARLLGWDYKTINQGTGPQDARRRWTPLWPCAPTASSTTARPSPPSRTAWRRRRN